MQKSKKNKRKRAKPTRLKHPPKRPVQLKKQADVQVSASLMYPGMGKSQEVKVLYEL